MKQTLIFLFLLSISKISFGQINVTIPKDFIETNLPKFESNEWFLLNQSKNDFALQINNKLEIYNVKEWNLNLQKINNGGILISFPQKNDSTLLNNPNKSLQNKLEIKKGIINNVFTFYDKIYFIQTLQKNGKYSGANFYQLDTTNSVYKHKKLLGFNKNIHLVVSKNNRLFFATNKKLYEYVALKKKTIIKDAPWKYLKLTSIVFIDEGNAFVGISGGFLKINLIDHTTKLFAYKDGNEYSNECWTENESFQSISKPSEDSDLSKYLKEKISHKLLKSIPVESRYFNNNSIRLVFELDKKNKPWNLRIQTYDKALNDTIKKIFKSYPMEKLGLNYNNRIGVCSVQLISLDEDKIKIKASSIAVCDEQPKIEGSDSTQAYIDYSSYFYKTLNDFILKNLDYSTIKKTNIKGGIVVHLKLTINVNGSIINVNTLNSNKILKDEIDRVVKLYNKIVSPAMRNGKPRRFDYDTYFSLIIDDK